MKNVLPTYAKIVQEVLGFEYKLKSHIQNVHERVKCNEFGQEMCNTFILKS